MVRCICVLLLAMGWLAESADANEIVLEPTCDNTLFEDENGSLSNGAGTGLFVGNNGAGNTRRTLIKFDVAGSLPDGARIDNVRLRFRVSSTPNLTSRTVTVHRVLQEWGESSSSTSGGRGAPAETGDATWLHRFYPDLFWNTPGGDVESHPSFTGTLGDTAFYEWTGEQLVADVEFWLQNPTANFGWLFMGEEAGSSTVRRIDSREVESTGDRPTLLIAFTSTVTGIEALSWGQFKRTYR